MKIDQTVLGHTLETKHNRTKKHILIVEDDPFSQQLIASLLHEYEVTKVDNGKEALSAYALYAPDIVLLDIDMPEMTGIDVLRAITEADKGAYVVMLTAYTQAAMVKEAIGLGAKSYIAKPFNKTNILKHIKRAESA